MKYVMFIYQAVGYDPKALSPNDHKDVAQRYAAVNKALNVRPGPPLGARPGRHHRPDTGRQDCRPPRPVCRAAGRDRWRLP